MADDTDNDMGWQALAEHADRRVVQLERDVAGLEAAVARQSEHAGQWKARAERFEAELARHKAAQPHDDIRRAAIADIDNVLVERARLRGLVERLEAIVTGCPRCFVQRHTVGTITDERHEQPDGT